MGAPASELSTKIVVVSDPHSSKNAAVAPAQPQPGSATAVAEGKPKKKICCACPDTKRLRDECIVEHGEAACTKWIEAHKICLRAEGFNV